MTSSANGVAPPKSVNAAALHTIDRFITVLRTVIDDYTAFKARPIMSVDGAEPPPSFNMDFAETLLCLEEDLRLAIERIRQVNSKQALAASTLSSIATRKTALATHLHSFVLSTLDMRRTIEEERQKLASMQAMHRALYNPNGTCNVDRIIAQAHQLSFTAAAPAAPWKFGDQLRPPYELPFPTEDIMRGSALFAKMNLPHTAIPGGSSSAAPMDVDMNSSSQVRHSQQRRVEVEAEPQEEPQMDLLDF